MNRRLDPSDEDLVARIRDQAPDKAEAFETLITRHQSRVRTNCRHLTRAPQDADDLAQEVFVKAWFGLARFEGRSSFRTWIERVKINHCLNYIEKRAGKRFVDIDETDGHAPPPEMRVPPEAEQAIHRQEQRRLIGELLDELPDTLRVPLIMREIDQMSYQDIAERLDLSLSAVKMRIKRGREIFRGRYEARVDREAARL